MINNLLKSESGKIIISCILGLGLASLFKKVCVDDNCLIIRSPPGLEGKMFKFQDKCYTYTPHSVACPN
jgi:hypothetical protein